MRRCCQHQALWRRRLPCIAHSINAPSPAQHRFGVANVKKISLGSKAADLSCNINLNCMLLCMPETIFYLQQIDREQVAKWGLLAIHVELAAFPGFH